MKATIRAKLAKPRKPKPPSERTYLRHPKRAGLWIRVTLEDGSVIDGTISPNLMLQSWYEVTFMPEGEAPTPTEPTIVPRYAIAECVVMGTVGTTRARRLPK